MVGLMFGGLLVGLLIAAVVLRVVRPRRRFGTARRVEAAQRLSDAVGASRERRRLVREANDQELCDLWERSARELRSVRLATSLEWYADLRKEILDELTARNPAAIESWLTESPDSDPGPYLRRTR